MEKKIFEDFRKYKNEGQAYKMAKYMKFNFEFIGIPSPLRKEIQKDFLKTKLKENKIDWDFVFHCFEMPEREFQYLALNYLEKIKKQLEANDIDKIELLIQTKSWWDSVDGLDQLVGTLSQNYPKIIDTNINKWIVSENIWLKRVSIDFQLGFKEKTNTTILENAILYNLGTTEFFINKAIGWSLRDYSKTNKPWVIDFLKKNKAKMANLSIREASKYLSRE